MPTRRTRAAEREVSLPVAIQGKHPPVSSRRIERAVALVLEKERRRAALSIAFVGPDRIRRLNQAWKGHDRPTDVLAFSLPEPGGRLTGDIYICRAVAAREAIGRGIPVAEELIRLVIHGTLHVLGYDHPEDDSRIRSPMWRRQERYLACLS